MTDFVARAYEIERQLRAEGVPALLIPSILGAAFCAALTNLPPVAREAILASHLEVIEEIRKEIFAAPQAPDGLMEPFPHG